MILTCAAIYICIIMFATARALIKGTSNDFLYPKKRFGPWRLALSVWSTGESGWWALGLTGFGFAFGLQGLWFVAGEIIFTIIMWCFIAPRFYDRCEKTGACTVGVFLTDFFRDHNTTLRLVTTALIFCIVPLYISAQHASISRACEYFSLDYLPFMIIIFSAVFVIYSMIGGFYVISSMSVINGVIMFAGIAIVLIYTFYTFVTNNTQFDARVLDNGLFWSLWGQNGPDRINTMKALSKILAGAGFLGAPNILVKFLNARDSTVIKRAMPIGVLLFAFGDIMALGVGISGRFIVTNLIDSEMVISAVSLQLLPHILVGVVFVGVLAAIYSTADSLLLLISSSFIKDIYQCMLNNEANHSRENRIARALMVFAAVAGLFVSYADNRLVFWMVNFLWIIISCTFAPLVVIACYSDTVDTVTAASGILSGLVIAAIWNMFCVEVTGATGIVPGLLVSFLSIIIFHRLRRKCFCEKAASLP